MTEVVHFSETIEPCGAEVCNWEKLNEIKQKKGALSYLGNHMDDEHRDVFAVFGAFPWRYCVKISLERRGGKVMTKAEIRQLETERLVCESNSAKERLVRIAQELREIGANRKARTLEILIERLEVWQTTN